MIAFAAIAAAGCGAPTADPVAPAPTAPPAPTDWERGMSGHWMRFPVGTPVADEDLDRLAALGYAPGTETAGPATGVTVHDRRRAGSGLNLYCSGHAPEAVLMDMDGAVLHRWRFPYEALPNPVAGAHPWFTGSWRRVRLLDDGGLLAIYENLGLVKIDRDSNLRWYAAIRAHHDLDVLDDGSIVVLTRNQRGRTGVTRDPQLIRDVVVFLSPDGEELRRIDLLTAVHRSEEHRGLAAGIRLFGDVFHTNTIEVLDGRLERHGPAFRAGNILLSIRHLDAIAILDPETESIVWAATGSWRWQHEPTALANGNLLLFDNRGGGNASRILELDPSTLEIAWSYTGDPPESFFSTYCGAASRLGNGNTLIVETCPGRAFEVTPDGERVWDFHSPHRAGDNGELVAALFDLVRIPDRPGWLDEGPK